MRTITLMKEELSNTENTWKYFLEIEKNRYPILIFNSQLRGTIKYSFAVVWGEDTAQTRPN